MARMELRGCQTLNLPNEILAPATDFWTGIALNRYTTTYTHSNSTPPILTSITRKGSSWIHRFFSKIFTESSIRIGPGRLMKHDLRSNPGSHAVILWPSLPTTGWLILPFPFSCNRGDSSQWSSHSRRDAALLSQWRKRNLTTSKLHNSHTRLTTNLAIAQLGLPKEDDSQDVAIH